MIQREKNAEMIRRLRAEAVAAGLCSECRCRAPIDGKRTCETCLDRKRERKAAYKGVGLCRCGRDPVDGGEMCQRCRDRSARRSAEETVRRKAAGMCQRHGCKSPARDGRSHCAVHAAAISAYATDYAARRVAAGLCFQCGQPNPLIAWRCPACAEKFRAYHAEWSKRKREARP